MVFNLTFDTRSYYGAIYLLPIKLITLDGFDFFDSFEAPFSLKRASLMIGRCTGRSYRLSKCCASIGNALLGIDDNAIAQVVKYDNHTSRTTLPTFK